MEGKMNALLKTAAEPDAMEYVEDFDIPQIKDDEVLMLSLIHISEPTRH